MPEFERLPVQEAKLKSARGRRAQVNREYVGYIEQLAPGQAGKLTPAQGERVGAVRRRLGVAARAAGKELVIRRAGDEVYFWLAKEGPRRPGRPRKSG